MVGKVSKFLGGHYSGQPGRERYILEYIYTGIFKICTSMFRRVFDIADHNSSVRLSKFYAETVLPT